MPKLIRRTKRLEIRPLRLSDYEAWKIANSTRMPPRNIWDRANREDVSMGAFRKILKSQKENRVADRFYDLAVFERSSGCMVGSVSAMDVLRGLGQSAYLGYFLDNLFWGRGYGKEMVKAMIDIAFRDLKLHRIEAGIEPRNRRSIMLARSLGLRKEGLKRRAVFLRGKWIDLVMYSATCEEFGFKWKAKVEARLR